MLMFSHVVSHATGHCDHNNKEKITFVTPVEFSVIDWKCSCSLFGVNIWSRPVFDESVLWFNKKVIYRSIGPS